MPIEHNVRSRPPTSVRKPVATFDQKIVRPWSDAILAIKRSWGGASTTQQFLLLALVIAVAPMTLLGLLVSDEIKSAKISSITAVEAFHFRMVAEPLLGDGEPDDVLPGDIEDQLDAWFAAHPTGTLQSAHIWLRDGTIAYSTEKQLVGRQFTSSELAPAFDGELLADMELTNYGTEYRAAAEVSLLEIYIPLRHLRTGDVLAVGEVYRRVDGLNAQLRQANLSVWSIVGIVTALMTLLSLVIVRRTEAIVVLQRKELKRRLSKSVRLAKFNARLRQEAVQARVEAIQTNEALLNQIGSDLHDGPIQLLSLLVLQLQGSGEASPKTSGGATAKREDKNTQLATDSIRELRNLSHGLILPEIDHLDVIEALRLAVIRHEELTGTKVKAQFHDLPDQIAPILKICLYRVIQESLTNAFRHADGVEQRVAAKMERNHIEIEISNGQPAVAHPTNSGRTAGIGMLGLARRVASVDGEMTVEPNASGGTTVRARVPIELNEQRNDQLGR